MRLDLFLKKTRIVKTRTKSKYLCDKGMVTVNGLKSKPGKGVKLQDKILIDFGKSILEIEVVELPGGNISKDKAQSYYKVTKNEKVDLL